MTATRSTMVAFRIPRDLDTDLRAVAQRAGTDLSTVARRFLRQRTDEALVSSATGPAILDRPNPLDQRGGTHRQNDRPTAKRAAADVAPRVGSQRRTALAWFARCDDTGLTTDDVVVLLQTHGPGNPPHNGIARRVTDLLEVGAIEPVYASEHRELDGSARAWSSAPVTRRTRAGAQAQVWRITAKGRAWLNA